MENPLILCISTPTDNSSQIALVEAPWEKVQKRTDIVQHILSIADSFWEEVWGIIWNGIIQRDNNNWRSCFSIELPKRGIEYSSVDSRSFPWNWDSLKRQDYIIRQVHKIMKYGAANPVFLTKWVKWSSLKYKWYTNR